MWKVGVFTDEISQDFEYALAVAKELGAGYVELRSMWGKNLVDLSSSELEKAKELIKKSNLKVSIIASPFFKCHLKKKEAKKSRDT
ncbi:MAG: sugar phosphate isomerase/epimerase, partial [Clostridia bacterium]|nr:sugar phosphate isomerase/epimerase [Clostridia bacterium]